MWIVIQMFRLIRIYNELIWIFTINFTKREPLSDF
jgi:hypothetical protein